MIVAQRTPAKAKGQFTVAILDVAFGGILKEGEAYKVDPDKSQKVVTLDVRGDKNSKARLKKLAEHHEAILIDDSAAIAVALTAEVASKPAVEDKPKRTKKKTAPPADEGSEAEADLDMKLLEMGFEGEQIARATLETKAAIVGDGIKPEECSISKKGKLNLTKKGKEAVKAAAEEVKEEAEDESEEETENPTLAGNVGEVTKRIHALKPDEGDEGIKTLIEQVEALIPVEEAGKNRKGVLGALDSRVKKLKRSLEPKKTGSTLPIRGYRVMVTKDDWGQVDGKNRLYELGKTPDETEMQRVQGAWETAGYTVTVKVMRGQTRGPVDHTLWQGAPAESDPIVSLIEGDAWVGDHLGPHLKARGMTIAEYREQFDYKGPAMVNRASRALAAAHAKVRKEHGPRIGSMVLEINGDTDVTVYRIDARNDADDGTITFDVVAVAASKLNVGKDSKPLAWTMKELVERTKPVQRWTDRIVKESGAGKTEEKPEAKPETETKPEPEEAAN